MFKIKVKTLILVLVKKYKYNLALWYCLVAKRLI